MLVYEFRLIFRFREASNQLADHIRTSLAMVDESLINFSGAEKMQRQLVDKAVITDSRDHPPYDDHNPMPLLSSIFQDNFWKLSGEEVKDRLSEFFRDQEMAGRYPGEKTTVGKSVVKIPTDPDQAERLNLKMYCDRSPGFTRTYVINVADASQMASGNKETYSNLHLLCTGNPSTALTEFTYISGNSDTEVTEYNNSCFTSQRTSAAEDDSGSFSPSCDSENDLQSAHSKFTTQIGLLNGLFQTSWSSNSSKLESTPQFG
jgi:hypothetical protein